jgi:serine phosphatase RsbU (regulator of sigma subunit)
MGTDLEKRLASELNRLADESSGKQDKRTRQKRLEQLRRIADELKAQLLGGDIAKPSEPGRRSGVDEIGDVVARFERAMRKQQDGIVPWQRAATFDDFRASGLRDVLARIDNRTLRRATVAAADPAIAARAGEKRTSTTSAAGHAMWRAAERRAATLYRHAQDSGEVASEDPVVDEALARCGSGHALPSSVRKKMENELGVSLARVRVHTDPVAAAAARAVRAEAFTVGEDIFFAERAYSPESREGQKLLAHELTHVVQAYQGRTAQGGTGISVSQPGESLEREADAVAERITTKPKRTAGSRAPRARGSSPVLGRQPTAVAQPAVTPARNTTLLRKAEPDSAAPPSSSRGERGPNGERSQMPRTQLERDRSEENARRTTAQPGEELEGQADELAASVADASKPGHNALRQTVAQANAEPPGKTAKEAGRAQGKQHRQQEHEAKEAQNQVAAVTPNKPKPLDAPQRDHEQSEDPGAIEFKKIDDWEKYMPEALPDQDERERKRILALVKKQVNEDRRESRQMLEQLRKAQLGQAAAVRALAPGLVGQIRGAEGAAIGKVNASEASQTSALQAHIAGVQAQVRATATQVKQQIGSAHQAAVGAIESAKQAATQQLIQAKTKALGDIDKSTAQQIAAVVAQYAATRAEIIALGNAKGAEARALGDSVPLPYDGDKLEAARGAAKDVAAEYATAMPKEATNAANQVCGSQAQVEQQVRKIAEDQKKAVEQAFTQAKQVVDQSAEQARSVAGTIKDQATSQVEQTASTAIAQLGAHGATQAAAIRQQAAGARSSIQRASASAQQAVSASCAQAALGIEKGVKGLVKGAKQIEAPNVEQTKQQVRDGIQQLQQGTKQIGTGLTRAAMASGTQLDSQATTAATDIAKTATDAKATATQIGSGAQQGMTHVGQGASQGLQQLGENYQQSSEKIAKEGAKAMTELAAKTQEAYTAFIAQVRQNLSGAVAQITTSFNEAVPTKETADIMKNAEKAAAAVKPWWQKALAFVVSIVVAIVVVVVVTALIVTTGPIGMILVGAAAGALGSVLGQMASNLILGNGLTEGITWQTVALGAVGGGIGAGFSVGVTAGARALAVGGGRFAGAGTRVVTSMSSPGGGSLGGFGIKTGVGITNDFISDTASQLIVTGGYEFSMENLAASLVSNAATTTRRYENVQERVQGRIQTGVGHIQIAGPGGLVSAHGPGSPPATGTPVQVGRSGPHWSGGDLPGGTPPPGYNATAPQRPPRLQVSSEFKDLGQPPPGGQADARPAQTVRAPDAPQGGRPADGPAAGDAAVQPDARASAGQRPADAQAGDARTGGGQQADAQRTGDGPPSADGHTPVAGVRADRDGVAGDRDGGGGDRDAAGGDRDGARTDDGGRGDRDGGQDGDRAAAAGDRDGGRGDRDARGDRDGARGDRDGGDRDQARGDRDGAGATGDRDGARAAGDRDGAQADGQGRAAQVDGPQGDRDGGAQADRGGPSPGSDRTTGDRDGGQPDSALASDLNDLGYPNATRAKAEQAAAAIEAGGMSPPDAVRDTNANQQGLRDLAAVDADPRLSPESKQNIRRDVARQLRADEPSGNLQRDVAEARAREQQRLQAEQPARGLDRVPPADELAAAQRGFEDTRQFQQAAGDNVRIATSSQGYDGPARASGDFMKVMRGEDGRVHMLHGDMAGHGKDAAEMSVGFHRALDEQGLRGVLEQRGLTAVDDAITANQLRVDGAMNHLALDPNTGALDVQSVGDSPVFIVRRDGSVQRIEADAPTLGWQMLSEINSKVQKVQLQPGDRVVAISDGVSEGLAGGRGGLEGINKAQELIGQAVKDGASLDQIVNRLRAPDDAKLGDDSTVFAFQWDGPGSARTARTQPDAAAPWPAPDAANAPRTPDATQADTPRPPSPDAVVQAVKRHIEILGTGVDAGNPIRERLSPDTPVFRVQDASLKLAPHESPFFDPSAYNLPGAREYEALYISSDKTALDKLRRDQGYFDQGLVMHETTIGALLESAGPGAVIVQDAKFNASVLGREQGGYIIVRRRDGQAVESRPREMTADESILVAERNASAEKLRQEAQGRERLNQQRSQVEELRQDIRSVAKQLRAAGHGDAADQVSEALAAARMGGKETRLLGRDDFAGAGRELATSRALEQLDMVAGRLPPDQRTALTEISQRIRDVFELPGTSPSPVRADADQVEAKSPGFKRVTESADVRAMAHVAVGDSLASLDVATATSHALSKGDIDVFARLGVVPPQGFDPRTVSWGVGTTPDGRYVLVRGDQNGVDWSKAPDVTPVSSTKAMGPDRARMMTQEELARLHPGEQGAVYHHQAHSEIVSDMAFRSAVDRGLSPEQANFIAQVGQLHDIDPTRKPGTPARVPATVEALIADFKGERPLIPGYEGKSVIRERFGWDYGQLMMGLAMIRRTEFPFTDPHGNPVYKKEVHLQGTEPVTLTQVKRYEYLLEQISRMDAGSVSFVDKPTEFVVREAALLSEYADKGNYAAVDFDSAMSSVAGLVNEINAAVGKPIVDAHALGTPTFLASIGTDKAFAIDREIAARHGTDIKTPGREELYSKMPSLYQRQYDAQVAGFKEFDRVLADALKSAGDAKGGPLEKAETAAVIRDNMDRAMAAGKVAAEHQWRSSMRPPDATAADPNARPADTNARPADADANARPADANAQPVEKPPVSEGFNHVVAGPLLSVPLKDLLGNDRDFHTAAMNAVKRANKEGFAIKFEFNGSEVVVNPGENPRWVTLRYHFAGSFEHWNQKIVFEPHPKQDAAKVVPGPETPLNHFAHEMAARGLEVVVSSGRLGEGIAPLEGGTLHVSGEAVRQGAPTWREQHAIHLLEAEAAQPGTRPLEGHITSKTKSWIAPEAALEGMSYRHKSEARERMNIGAIEPEIRTIHAALEEARAAGQANSYTEVAGIALITRSKVEQQAIALEGAIVAVESGRVEIDNGLAKIDLRGRDVVIPIESGATPQQLVTRLRAMLETSNSVSNQLDKLSSTLAGLTRKHDVAAAQRAIDIATNAASAARGEATVQPHATEQTRAPDDGERMPVIPLRKDWEMDVDRGAVPEAKREAARVKYGDLIARLEAEGEIPMPTGQASVDMMAGITLVTGKEVGLYRIEGGGRVLVFGDATNVGGPKNQKVRRLIAHTHPSGELIFSPGDVYNLQEHKQKSSVLISPGGRAVRQLTEVNQYHTQASPEAVEVHSRMTWHDDPNQRVLSGDEVAREAMRLRGSPDVPLTELRLGPRPFRSIGSNDGQTEGVIRHGVDTASDLAAIRAGQATRGPDLPEGGRTFEINGRVYGEQYGHVFALRGDGVIQLDTGAADVYRLHRDYYETAPEYVAKHLEDMPKRSRELGRRAYFAERGFADPERPGAFQRMRDTFAGWFGRNVGSDFEADHQQPDGSTEVSGLFGWFGKKQHDPVRADVILSVPLESLLKGANDIDTAAKNAVKQANRDGFTIAFEFNGTRVLARPGDTPDVVRERYMHDSSQPSPGSQAAPVEPVAPAVPDRPEPKPARPASDRKVDGMILSVGLQTLLKGANDIDTAAKNAVKMANREGFPISFDFNGQEVIVRPGDSPEVVRERYMQDSGRPEPVDPNGEPPPDLARLLRRPSAEELAEKGAKPDLWGSLATAQGKQANENLPPPPAGMIRLIDGTLASGQSQPLSPDAQQWLAARRAEHAELSAGGPRKVVVDGGGPTGALTALQAYHLGHEVTIVEMRDQATLPILWNNRAETRQILELIDPVLAGRLYDGKHAGEIKWSEYVDRGETHVKHPKAPAAPEPERATGDPRAIAGQSSAYQTQNKTELTLYWDRLTELEAKERTAAEAEGRTPRLRIMRGYTVVDLPADGSRRGVVVAPLVTKLRKFGSDGRPELGPDGKTIDVPYKSGDPIPDGYKRVKDEGEGINLGTPDDLFLAEGAGSRSRAKVGAAQADVGPEAHFIAGYFEGAPVRGPGGEQGGGRTVLEHDSQGELIATTAGTGSHTDGTWALPQVDSALKLNDPKSIEAYFGKPMSAREATLTYYKQQVAKVLQVDPSQIPDDGFVFGPAAFKLQSHVTGPVDGNSSNVHLLGDSRGNSHFFASLGKVTGTGAHQMAIRQYYQALSWGLDPTIASALLDRRLDAATRVWLKSGLQSFNDPARKGKLIGELDESSPTKQDDVQVDPNQQPHDTEAAPDKDRGWFSWTRQTSRGLTDADRQLVREAQAQVATMKPRRIDDPNNPNLVQLMIAFDGSGLDRATSERSSNAALLEEAFDGPKHYEHGIATEPGLVGSFNFLTGTGMQQRIDSAYANLVDQINSIKSSNPHAEIVLNLTGYSRGAAAARAFVNQLEARGIPVQSSGRGDGTYGAHHEQPRVGVMVLFDTVQMTVDRSLDLSISPRAENVLHLTSRDERRSTHPLTRAVDPAHPDSRITELELPGDHGDIGGYGNGLSLQIARQYMERAGVKLKPQEGPIADVDDPALRLHQQAGINFGRARFDSHNPAVEQTGVGDGRMGNTTPADFTDAGNTSPALRRGGAISPELKAQVDSLVEPGERFVIDPATDKDGLVDYLSMQPVEYAVVRNRVTGELYVVLGTAEKVTPVGGAEVERVLFHNQPMGGRELSPQDQAYFAKGGKQKSTLVGTPDGVFRDVMSRGPEPEGDGNSLHAPAADTDLDFTANAPAKAPAAASEVARKNVGDQLTERGYPASANRELVERLDEASVARLARAARGDEGELDRVLSQILDAGPKDLKFKMNVGRRIQTTEDNATPLPNRTDRAPTEEEAAQVALLRSYPAAQPTDRAMYRGMKWSEYQKWVAARGFPGDSAESGGMRMKFATDSYSKAWDYAQHAAGPGEPAVIVRFDPYKAEFTRKPGDLEDEFVIARVDEFVVEKIHVVEGDAGVAPASKPRSATQADAKQNADAQEPDLDFTNHFAGNTSPALRRGSAISPELKAQVDRLVEPGQRFVIDPAADKDGLVDYLSMQPVEYAVVRNRATGELYVVRGTADQVTPVGGADVERVLFHNQPTGGRELSPQDQAYFAKGGKQKSTLVGTPEGVFRDFMSKGPEPEGDGDSLNAPVDPEERKRYFGLGDKTVQLGGKERPESRIFDVLGKSRLAPVRLVNETHGKVMWVDLELAREYGFTVGEGNRMTPQLHEELIRALSYRVLPEGTDPQGRDVVEGQADRYLGSRMGAAQGAGRAAFLPGLNANIKGVGRTPLAAPAQGGDFSHEHGGAPAREGLLEATWGLVSENMFSTGGTRILAVIDLGDNTPWKDGGFEPRALIVRVGNQLRPAHIFDRSATPDTPDTFERMARESGILVETAKGEIDYRATMLEALDRQARLSAENYRNRVLHGSVTTSNMEWDGGMLDHGTTTSVSRTERARVVGWEDQFFGNEHVRRAEELSDVYDKIRSGAVNKRPKPSNEAIGTIDFARTMKERYAHHMAVQAVDATGIKRDMAESLATKQPKIVAELRDVIHQLSQLSESGNGTVSIDKAPAPDYSTVDVFNLLGKFPARYFADPTADHRATIRELLAPKRELTPQAQQLVDKFAVAYHKVMQAARSEAGEFYDNDAAMQRSVTARAKFENAPTDLLQRANMGQRLNQAIEDFRSSSGHMPVDHPAYGASVREAVDKAVSESVRSAEGLLTQGTTKRLPDGGLETQQRVIDGIVYSVRAWENGTRRLRVSIPVSGDDGAGYMFPTLRVNNEGHAPHLFRDQINAMEYRFTVDGWQTPQSVYAQVVHENGAPKVVFDIPALAGDIGKLEGLFHSTGRGDFWWHDGQSNFRGYTYAVPDQHDMGAVAERAVDSK